MRQGSRCNLGLVGSRWGEHLVSIYDAQPDKSVRSAVIQALFLQSNVTARIELARRDASTRVRGQALFWLAQKAGKKAVAAVVEHAARLGVSGGGVYDVLLLACARKCGADIVYTLDARDFPRLAQDLGQRVRVVSAASPAMAWLEGRAAVQMAARPARAVRPFKVGVVCSGIWQLDQWQSFYWGQASDVPVLGDWNGSGTVKAGSFRDGVWFLDFNGNGQRKCWCRAITL